MPDALYRATLMFVPLFANDAINGLASQPHLTGIGGGVVRWTMALLIVGLWFYVLHRYEQRLRRAWLKSLDPVRHSNVVVDGVAGQGDFAFMPMNGTAKEQIRKIMDMDTAEMSTSAKGETNGCHHR